MSLLNSIYLIVQWINISNKKKIHAFIGGVIFFLTRPHNDKTFFWTIIFILAIIILFYNLKLYSDKILKIVKELMHYVHFISSFMTNIFI